MKGFKPGFTRKDLNAHKAENARLRHESFKEMNSGKAKHNALKKKTGSGEYSKVTFTPKNKNEERAFNKRFNSKTS